MKIVSFSTSALKTMKEIPRVPTLSSIKEDFSESDEELIGSNGHIPCTSVSKYGTDLIIPNFNVQLDLSEDNHRDLDALKETTTRLRLNTRRPSYVTWKEMYLEKSKPFRKPNFEPSAMKDDYSLSDERKIKINEALGWIRSELIEMRSQDQDLARQLLAIRSDIQQLRLQWSCEEHQEMLDDVTLDLAQCHKLQEICDIPLEASVTRTPLHHIGVTKHNLSARRFSAC